MIHTIRIEKLIHGGKGLARLEDGMVVLIPFVLTGEKVSARETMRKRGYIEAEPLEILEPSAARVAPPCPYYMECGGCDLQHISLEEQHRIKEEVVRESFARAGVQLDEKNFASIVPSPEPFHYRYRVRLKVSRDGDIGFYRAGSNSIIPVDHCQVATGKLNEALARLRGTPLLETILRDTGEIELLQSPADDSVFSVLHLLPQSSPAKESITALAGPLGGKGRVAISSGRKLQWQGQDENTQLRQDFSAAVCGRPYSLAWSPGCFSQVNMKLNTEFVRLVCRLAGDVSGKKVLDLYCGTGNFSIPLGLKGADVTGVERHRECIGQAGENALRAGLNRSRFHDQDVHKWMRKTAKKGGKYDLVLLDPPRQGMGREIIMLAELSPERIIYISCDPATLARDVALLTDHGYRLAGLTPVDMFPQTHHIESVALLEKN